MYNDPLTTLHISIARATEVLKQAPASSTDVNEYTIAKLIAQLDGCIYEVCNALAMLHAMIQYRSADELPPYDIWTKSDYTILRTPYLHKRKQPIHESYVTCGSLIDQTLRAITLPKFPDAINIDFLPIYAQDTPVRQMTDVDNVSKKRIIDRIAANIGIDDGGTAVRYSVENLLTDRVPPGMYTVMSPRRSQTEHPLLSLIEEVIQHDDK